MVCFGLVYKRAAKGGAGSIIGGVMIALSIYKRQPENGEIPFQAALAILFLAAFE
ncbi:hypothetical protein GCWU000324_01107 [Kingella oralis ATCC 51147]|jgi:hypothetical protein|uniref:Uncharacterized protein n=1 Tax=Kingella oralis ATCC 51147 TaxID=629741 RepID=C4GG40_9NEIS|nr:hypothetical protein GCWU000324_01107 [Kingella oralis ATCC 51147]